MYKVIEDVTSKADEKVVVCHELASHNKNNIIQNCPLEEMAPPYNALAKIVASQDICHQLS